MNQAIQTTHFKIQDVVFSIILCLPMMWAVVSIHAMYIGWWYPAIVLYIPLILTAILQPNAYYLTALSISNNACLWLVWILTVQWESEVVLWHILGMVGWVFGWIIGLLKQTKPRTVRYSVLSGLIFPSVGFGAIIGIIMLLGLIITH